MQKDKENKLWKRLFGFQVGELVRHNKYPKFIWKVIEVNGRSITIRRLTKSDSLVPYRITFTPSTKIEETRCLARLEKILKV